MIYVTFPADEHEENIVTSVSVDVHIEDDNLEESLHQYFIATLEPVNTTSPMQARIPPANNNISLCAILDNENGT